MKDLDTLMVGRPVKYNDIFSVQGKMWNILLRKTWNK